MCTAYYVRVFSLYATTNTSPRPDVEREHEEYNYAYMGCIMRFSVPITSTSTDMHCKHLARISRQWQKQKTRNKEFKATPARVQRQTRKASASPSPGSDKGL